MIAGVGGQGNVVASRIVAEAAVAEGFLVTVGETYGASQRGGSVVSHVRLSKDSQPGPIVPRGEAHIILGLEPMETLRALKDFGNRQVRVVTATGILLPINVQGGGAPVPPSERVMEAIRELSQWMIAVDALGLAAVAGDRKARNSVMVGALGGCDLLPLTMEGLRGALGLIFQGERREVNLKAFDLGVAAARE